MTDVVSRPELLGGISRAKAPEPELGTAPIAGERYWSPEFAQREWDGMWTKVWLIAGMVNQLPKPGDYVTFEIGRESILCVRGTTNGSASSTTCASTEATDSSRAERRHARSAASSSAPTTAGGSATTARLNWVSRRGGLRRGQPVRRAQPRRDPVATRGPGSSGSTWTRTLHAPARVARPGRRPARLPTAWST